MTGLPPELYVVAEAPAPLAGMPFPPADTDWRAVQRRGFAQLLRLHPGGGDPSPLGLHELPLEDLHGGREPRDPSSERERVLRAARIAAEHVRRGEGVVVHCVGGTGRTGTVLACALRLLGSSPDEAVAAIRSHRPGWPESAWQEQVVRSLEPPPAN